MVEPCSEVLKYFREMVEYLRKCVAEGREFGFSVVNGEIREMTSRGRSVAPPDLREGEVPFLDYHTHVGNDPSKVSPEDIYLALEREPKYICVGSSTQREINCWRLSDLREVMKEIDEVAERLVSVIDELSDELVKKAIEVGVADELMKYARERMYDKMMEMARALVPDKYGKYLGEISNFNKKLLEITCLSQRVEV